MKTYFVITLFPDMIKSFIQHGVLSQAIKNQRLQIESINPRDFTTDVHKTVDDRPFGGGDGMIMMADPLQKAVESIPTEKRKKVIYLSPQGKKFDDKMARALAEESDLVFICGRYGGIDQRLINTFVDEEISIGDYVLSGGEFGALVMIDAISRMVPGVLGHSESAHEDSFAKGLLEHPNFTRPREILDQSVPEVLSSGNHKLIGEWKMLMSFLVTLKKRPDLLKNENGSWKFSEKDQRKIEEFWSQLSPGVKLSCGLDDFKLEF